MRYAQAPSVIAVAEFTRAGSVRIVVLRFGVNYRAISEHRFASPYLGVDVEYCLPEVERDHFTASKIAVILNTSPPNLVEYAVS